MYAVSKSFENSLLTFRFLFSFLAFFRRKRGWSQVVDWHTVIGLSNMGHYTSNQIVITIFYIKLYQYTSTISGDKKRRPHNIFIATLKYGASPQTAKRLGL
jgi:hypothetical protein